MSDVPTQPTALIVDDDPKLRDLLEQFLGKHGYQTVALHDGSGIEEHLTDHAADIVILDVMLPGEDGMAICRRLRGRDIEVPIIMLTGKGDELDRIIGLEMGADDYLPKPFNPRELLARMQAVLRRQRSRPAPTLQIAFGDFVLDLDQRVLQRDGRDIRLTTGEFDLLRVLAERPRQPLDRDQLLDLTRGRSYDAIDRSIDVQISRLRRLLEADPKQPRYIQTVWGMGYVFVPDGTGR